MPLLIIAQPTPIYTPHTPLQVHTLGHFSSYENICPRQPVGSLEVTKDGQISLAFKTHRFYISRQGEARLGREREFVGISKNHHIIVRG